jgi:hypothetical protein
MTEEQRHDRDRRGILLSASAFAGALLVEFLTNVAANYVHVPTGSGGWLARNWSLLLAGLALAGLATFAARRFLSDRPGPRAQEAAPLPLDTALPAAVQLEGRAGTVWEVVDLARRHGVVVVHGPAGIGVSAVAISAGHDLASRPEMQRYIDLRGQNPRHPESTGRSVIRVLSVFGLRPGYAQDPQRAIAPIAEALRDTGIVLILDNAERTDQVAWITRGVRGAYVIIAGDITGRDLPGDPPPVRVPSLGRDAAIALLARQGETGKAPDAPRARMRRLRRMRRRGAAANSVAMRISAEPAAAAELADRYLTFPRVAVEMGRWLAANPQVTLAAVVQDLKQDQQNSELGYIVGRQLDGTSAGARRLLGVLAQAPVAELSQAAVAAMADASLDRTGEHLAELSSRSLVQWSRPSRCRITPEARQLAAPPSAKAAARAVTRLARYFAALAAGHAEALAPGQDLAAQQQAQDWFRTEDVTLLGLLSMATPAARAAPHLWQIAAALDAWFGCENRPDDRRSAAEAMARAAASLGDGTAAAIAELRLSALARSRGDFAAAGQSLERAHRLLAPGSPWQNQLHSEWAAYFMTIGDLDAAREHLLASRQTRSRQDPARRAADRINQAALEIHAGELGTAHGTLLQALDVAEESAGLDSQAHAHELLGLVAWRTGHPRRAVRAWSQARALYQQAGDDHGFARCLQHEGSARLAQPDTHPGAHPDADPGRAVAMLQRSLDLRGAAQSGIGVALTHLYLGEAAARTAALPELARHCDAGLAALRAWDREAIEPREVTEARARLTELSRTAVP